MMYMLILEICVQSVYIGVTIDDKLSSDAQRRIEHERDNQQILREIVLNPTIHGKELESIFGLSETTRDIAFNQFVA